MDFKEFPKMARLSREIIVTEKIDGTNAQICITEDGQFLVDSRTRWITPEDDNYGFAKWAHENKAELMKLGVGNHYGEWWGKGIQRGYNVPDKRFYLFNTHRWSGEATRPACCGVVPVLYQGPFDLEKIENELNYLKLNGSKVSPGFMKPEGVVIFHTSSNSCFKKTIEKDEIPKSLVGKRCAMCGSSESVGTSLCLSCKET